MSEEATRLREGIELLRDQIDVVDGLVTSAELYTMLSAILDEPPRLPLAPEFERKRKFKQCIALDFDGVVHAFTSGWTTTSEVNDGPTKGALDAVHSYLNAGFDVVIYSTRSTSTKGKTAICDWLQLHGFPKLKVTHMKPHAKIYIDDRGYRFTGNNFPSPVEIQHFRPWNRR